MASDHLCRHHARKIPANHAPTPFAIAAKVYPHAAPRTTPARAFRWGASQTRMLRRPSRTHPAFASAAVADPRIYFTRESADEVAPGPNRAIRTDLMIGVQI